MKCNDVHVASNLDTSSVNIIPLPGWEVGLEVAEREENEEVGWGQGTLSPCTINFIIGLFACSVKSRI